MDNCDFSARCCSCSWLVFLPQQKVPGLISSYFGVLWSVWFPQSTQNMYNRLGVALLTNPNSCLFGVWPIFFSKSADPELNFIMLGKTEGPLLIHFVHYINREVQVFSIFQYFWSPFTNAQISVVHNHILKF